MSVLAKVFAPQERAHEIGNRPLTAASLVEVFGGKPTSTGKRINEASALNVSTVLACVRVLSETIGSLPLPLYERLQPRGKRRAVEHPLYRVLHGQPNPHMSRYTFLQTLVGHVALWGNAFASVVRSPDGQVEELWPLHPGCMEPPKLAASGDLIYLYHLPSGEPRTLSSRELLHVRGLGSDGRWGYSVVQLMREPLGLALATEEFMGRFTSNMARPGGVLSVKSRLTPEGAERLKNSWQSAHGGLENAHRVAVLEEGVEWIQVGVPPQDAQLLETRKYQRSEIAAAFRMPPHLIGDLDRSTNNNIEQQSLEFVIYTLTPWLVNLEQQINVSLLTAAEQARYFAEFLVDGLLRGDSQTRSAFYTAMFDRGAFSPNDIREIENRNPIAGGDTYFVPLNYAPLEQVATGQAAPDAQASDAPPDEGDLDPAKMQLLIMRLTMDIQRLEEMGMPEEAEKLRKYLVMLVEQQTSGAATPRHGSKGDKSYPKFHPGKTGPGGVFEPTTKTGKKLLAKDKKKEGGSGGSGGGAAGGSESKPTGGAGGGGGETVEFKGKPPKEFQAAWQQSLKKAWTKEEHRAADLYTGEAYQLWNSQLRPPPPKLAAKQIGLLTGALNKTALNQPTILYRGVVESKQLPLSRFKPGAVITETAFTSTSLSRSVSETFAGAAMLRIHAPQGTRGAYMESVTQVKGEHEFLMPPGVRYKVRSVKSGDPGIIEVDLV